MSADRTYPSRVDAWLLGLIGLPAALPFAAGVWMIAADRPGAALPLGWGLFTLGFVGAISLPIRYTLRATDLHIRSGVLVWTVPYAALRRVAPSNNPLSAPAWSLRRLRLDAAGGDVILISPDDRESFMEELARRCPQLVRNGPLLESTA